MTYIFSPEGLQPIFLVRMDNFNLYFYSGWTTSTYIFSPDGQLQLIFLVRMDNLDLFSPDKQLRPNF